MQVLRPTAYSELRQKTDLNALGFKVDLMGIGEV